MLLVLSEKEPQLLQQNTILFMHYSCSCQWHNNFTCSFTKKNQQLQVFLKLVQINFIHQNIL